MRTLLLILVLAVCTFANSFCDGWAAGYKAGWCYGREYSCLEPLTPLCPLPRLGEDTFQDGYNRGFLAALSKRR